MSLRLRRKATRELTRMRLVLSPRRLHGGWFAFSALLAATVSIAATTHLVPGIELPFVAPVSSVAAGPVVAAAPDTSKALEKRLEQARLTLSISEARGQELERQVDALNQRLREAQDELTFFRKTREGKR
jgi:hypothetical protein